MHTRIVQVLFLLVILFDLNLAYGAHPGHGSEDPKLDIKSSNPKSLDGTEMTELEEAELCFKKANNYYYGRGGNKKQRICL